MATGLTSQKARGWTLRVPQLVISVGLPLTVLVAMFLPADDIYYSNVDQVVSVPNFVVSMLGAAWVGAAALAWAAPRVCLWVFAAICLSEVGSPTDPYGLVIGAAWVGVAIVDGILALRQSAIAAEWDPDPAAPPTRDRVEPLTGMWRWESLGAFVLAAAAAVVCVGWWINARGDLIAFDERAVPSSARITEVDTFSDSLQAKVGGKTYDFWVNDAADYNVGDLLPIRVDPTGDYPPMGPEDADPNSIDLVGPLAGPLMLLALLLLCTPRHRDRARLRLLDDERPLLARVRPWGEDDIEILTLDGRVLAIARDVLAIEDDHDEEIEDYDDPDDSLPILGERPRGAVEVDLSTLPPHVDLDAWLEESPGEDPADEFDVESEVPALVFGLERYGRPVIIEVTHDDGTTTTLVPGRPVRDPYTFGAVVSRIVSRATLPRRVNERVDNLSGRADKAIAPLAEDTAALLTRMARRTSVIGPLTCLVASWFVARWLASGEDIDPLFDGAVSAFLGASLGLSLATWHSAGRPLVRLGRWGVLVSGTLTDRLLPDHRLVDVKPGHRSVTISLKDPDERVRLIFDPRETARSEIDDIERVVSSATNRATRPPGSWTLPGHVPSPSAAIVVASTLIGLLATVLPF